MGVNMKCQNWLPDPPPLVALITAMVLEIFEKEIKDWHWLLSKDRVSEHNMQVRRVGHLKDGSFWGFIWKAYPDNIGPNAKSLISKY